MLIKSKTHKYSPGIFKYLIEYVYSDKGAASFEKNPCFFNNLYGNDPQEITAEFEANDAFRKPSNSVCLHHIILSFSPEDSDKITDEILHDLAQKFIQLRGDKGLVFGRVHNSTHKHLHLIFSSNEYRSEKSIRISRNEFANIQLELEKYQQEKYPFLSKSLVKLGRDKSQEKPRGLSEVEKKMQERGVKLRKTSHKAQILAFLNQSNHTTEFYDMLQKNGFKLYERKGKIIGIIAPSGRRYKFTTRGVGLQTIRELDELYMKGFNIETNITKDFY